MTMPWSHHITRARTASAIAQANAHATRTPPVQAVVILHEPTHGVHHFERTAGHS
jgi:hypothetical protein